MSFTNASSLSCEGERACWNVEASLSGDLRCNGPDACSGTTATFSGEEHAITCSGGSLACDITSFNFDAEPRPK